MLWTLGVNELVENRDSNIGRLIEKEEVMSILKIQFIDDEGRRCTSFLNTHHPCIEIIGTTIHSEAELDALVEKYCPPLSPIEDEDIFGRLDRVLREDIKPKMVLKNSINFVD